MTEAQLQDAIIACARALRWLVYHTHDSRHSAAGFPDLTLVRGRRLLFVELKKATGDTTAAQRAWMQALRDANVEVYLWRPVQWTNGEIEGVLR